MTQQRILSCPACENSMRVVERAGVSIDRCTACKGVFLDNGELEKLLTALRAPDQDDDDDWLKKPTRSYDDDDRHHRHDRHDSHEHHKHRHSHDHHGKHRKKSALHTFLEVFD